MPIPRVIGNWSSALDLNQIVGLPKDGLRSLLVTGEDVAGNPMPMNGVINTGVSKLDIFIDTQGPQVNDVFITGQQQYDLFDPKPSVNGPTPLVNQLTIQFTDNPNRLIPGFNYPGLVAGVATTPGNYRLVGDHVGTIAIQTIMFVPGVNVNGQPAVDSVILTFAAPLPDDRFTLTVLDNLVDPVGNKLDGESNSVEPLDNPTFPSGDGVPGGNFQARFTIDTRPEIGSFVSQNISIDINGNRVWDPANGQIGNDATNVDISFTMDAFQNGIAIAGNQSPHDLLVAGKFTAIGTNKPGARFFDQFATYGNYAGAQLWLIDFDSDGVVYGNGDPDGVNDLIQPQAIIGGFDIAAAIPIAGNFDNNLANGDEIGLYFSGQWALDTNHDYIIDTVLTGNLKGQPIVGDFDGNGIDDFGVFNNNVFSFGLNLSPNANVPDIVWGFPGVLDKAVAADMDQDGIDDIGLWVPRNSSATGPRTAEWYFLLSNTFNAATRAANFNTVNLLNHPFTPVPFGADIYAEFGDDRALPIVGNFDPPVAAQSITPQSGVPGDHDGDGDADGRDFLAWQRSGGSSQNLATWSQAYPVANVSVPISADVDSDGDVDGHDFIALQRNTGALLGGANVASWQASYSGSSSLGASLSAGDSDQSASSVSAAAESAPAPQEAVDSPALFWLSLPEQVSATSDVEFFANAAEPQIEQARLESRDFRASTRAGFDYEEYQFGADEDDADADFELALDEAFSEMGS